jgi:hypothetical protein
MRKPKIRRFHDPSEKPSMAFVYLTSCQDRLGISDRCVFPAVSRRDRTEGIDIASVFLGEFFGWKLFRLDSNMISDRGSAFLTGLTY